MNGADRTRFCASCQLNVYNLSAMTKKEAENLIVKTEGRLCVRFYRRADGTVLTQNCPTGLKALKKRISKAAAILFSTITSFYVGNIITDVFSFSVGDKISVSNRDSFNADGKSQGVFEVFPATKQEIGYKPDDRHDRHDRRYELGGLPRYEFVKAKPFSSRTRKHKR